MLLSRRIVIALCFFALLIPLEAASQTKVRDTFTASNGVLLRNHVPETNTAGGTWAITGAEDIVINSDAVRPTGAGNVMVALIEGGTADGRVSMDWTPLGSESAYGPYASLVFRATDATNFLQAVYWYGSLSLVRYTSSGPVTLTSVSMPAPGTVVHRIEARLSGSSIEIRWDGDLKIQYTESFNATATKHGMRWTNVYDYTSRYDNFTVEGSVGCGATATTTTASFGNGAGSGSFSVTAPAGCAWTASSSASWLTITGGVAAAGNATIAYSVSALVGVATRTATILVGTSTFTVTQSYSTAQTYISHSFTGANGTSLPAHPPDVNYPASTWVSSPPLPSAVLSGQRLVPVGQQPSTTFNYAYIDAAVSDAIIGVDWTAVSASATTSGYPIGGITFRVKDGLNYLVAGYGLGGAPFSVWKVVDESWTLLASTTVPSPAGATHHIEVRLNGSDISVWADGVERIHTASTYNLSETKHGLRWISVYDWLSSYDNFTVHALSPPPAASVAIAPANALVALNGTQAFTARAYDSGGRELQGASMQWSLSDVSAAALASGGANGADATVSGLARNAVLTATASSGAKTTALVSTYDPARTVLFDAFAGADMTALSTHVPNVALAGGGAWATSQPGAVIVGQRMLPPGQDTTTFLNYAFIDTATSDGVVGVDWTPAASGTASGYPLGAIMFRVKDGFNYLVAGYNLNGGSPFSVWKVINESWFLLGATTDIANPVGASHRIDVRMAGTDIRVFADGVEKLHVTDSYNLHETKHGLKWVAAYDWLSSFDNFTVEAVATQTIASVVVTPGTPTVRLGSSQTFSATALDAANNPIPDALLHWSISDPTAGRLVAAFYASSATVFGISAGLQVTATAINTVSGSATVAVDTTDVLVYDAFTDSDNAALAAHTPNEQNGGGWVQLGNVAAWIMNYAASARDQNTTSDDLTYAIETGAPDATVGVDINAAASGTLNGNPMGGLVFRVQNNTNYWVAGWGFGSYGLALWKVVNGQWFFVTTNTSVPGPVGAPHRLEVKLNGPTIQVWWDGTQHMQVTDFWGATATRHGLRWAPISDWGTTLDNFTVVGKLPCVTSITPTSATMASAGGTVNLTVSAANGCDFTVYSDQPVMTWSTATSGNVPGTTPLIGTTTAAITASYPANPTQQNTGGEWRGATILAGGQLAYFYQPPMPDPCNVTVSPGNGAVVAVSNAGEERVVNVTTALVPCSWGVQAASTYPEWLHLVDASGTQTGGSRYVADPNPNQLPREGSITVMGPAFAPVTIHIYQAAGPGACTFGVSQGSHITLFDWGVWETDLVTSAGCSWTATSDVPWMTVLPSSGTGPAVLTYFLAPNESGSARLGNIVVSGTNITIQQSAQQQSGSSLAGFGIRWACEWEPECEDAECGAYEWCYPDFEQPEPPRRRPRDVTLTLFVDADQNFSTTAPCSDHIASPCNGQRAYVPGSAMSDGYSVSLPDVVNLIAAYVNRAGVIVSPPESAESGVRFSLSGTSAFVGIAMNAGAQTSPDFSLAQSFASWRADKTARVQLRVEDYGGFTKATAQHGSSGVTLAIPYDFDNNRLPDVGWRTSFNVLVPDSGESWAEDTDGAPVGDGTLGDGLSRFEEYRGFFVTGSHLRTNPNTKDLFASSNVARENVQLGIQWAFPNLPLTVHRVIGVDEPGITEYDPGRVVNFNFTNLGTDSTNIPHIAQRALRVRLGSADGYAGKTYSPRCISGIVSVLTPWDVEEIQVNRSIHDANLSLGNSVPQILNELRRTIGHEIGHGLNIAHREENVPPTSHAGCIGANPGSEDSIMSSKWFDGPDVNDDRSKYNFTDIGQIRVKRP